MDTHDPNADLYYDRDEYLKAAASPEYKVSPRFRDEVAGKLQRSMQAGRFTSMAEEITHAQRVHTRTAYRPGSNENGYIVPGADPAWAAAGKVASDHYFKSPAEIADAFSAPAFEADRTYQDAVRAKIARSVREGFLTPDLKAADPAQRGS